MPFRYIFNNCVTVCASAYLVSKLWQDGIGLWCVVGFFLLVNLTKPGRPIIFNVKA